LNAGPISCDAPAATPSHSGVGIHTRTAVPAAHTHNDPITTSRVGTRRCSHGAATDPRTAATAEKESNTPISAGDAPSSPARTISTSVMALSTMLVPPTSTTTVRRNRCRHSQVIPSRMSASSPWADRARSSRRSDRTNSNATNDTA